mmetsp:Transcript_13720/g.29833  ORF Transcript_13720/g.29833 Transcript_13720/m.29833 type:complete len:203 (-) Transcript_13720:1297-1905(-)
MALSNLSEGSFDADTAPYRTPLRNSTKEGTATTPNCLPSAFPAAPVASAFAKIKSPPSRSLASLVKIGVMPLHVRQERIATKTTLLFCFEMIFSAKPSTPTICFTYGFLSSTLDCTLTSFSSMPPSPPTRSRLLCISNCSIRNSSSKSSSSTTGRPNRTPAPEESRGQEVCSQKSFIAHPLTTAAPGLELFDESRTLFSSSI